MSEEEALVRSESNCAVVWSTIPVLSWVLPFAGHIGVTDSHGAPYDFQGSRNVHKGSLLFGRMQERWVVHVDPDVWDAAIEEVTNEFNQKEYNFLTYNCHYYAAAVLDRVKYKMPKPLHGKWMDSPTRNIIWGMAVYGKILSAKDMFLIYFPFFLFCLIIYKLFL